MTSTLPGHAPRHIMVVGGSVRDWGDLGDEAWARRVQELGATAAAAGASWLTLRPFERGADAERARPIAHLETGVGPCTVVVDPDPNGRERLTVALRKLVECGGDTIEEAALTTALFAPAKVEPDLVLVLGDATRLPASLVWELAYSELVYTDLTWPELEAEHLRAAIDAYAHRHRRFGGLD